MAKDTQNIQLADWARKINVASLEEEIVTTADAVKLVVKIAGPKNGRPIIFLHGFPEFWYGWRHQISFFVKQGFRVVVPDQRGYNQSDKPKKVADYSLKHLANDVQAMIQQLQLKDPVLVGHDWGAAAAWHTAIVHHAIISKLVILNVPHPIAFKQFLSSNIKQLMKSWYMFFFQLPWLPAWLVSLNNKNFMTASMRNTANPGSFNEEDLTAYRQAWSQKNALDSMINWYRAALRYPDMRKNMRVNVPTQIIWGRKDSFLQPELAELSLKFCKNAKLQMLDDATHWVQHDQPDLVNQAILRFVDQD